MKRKSVLLIMSLLAAAGVAHAQSTTTTSAFTVTPAPSGGGLVFVSQSSGTVFYCTSWITVQGLGLVAGLTPSQTCATIGKVTPPASNWMVFPQGSYSVMMVNSSNGQIMGCAAGAGGPANQSALGSCKDMGSVPK